MQVHRLPTLLPNFHRAVVTIGTFDGVHSGHQQVLDQLCQRARQVGGESIVITFDPHPRMVIGSQPGQIALLNTLEEKIELLGRTGIDHLVIAPFDRDFATRDPEDYVRQFLVENFHPHTLIIGYDHRFGKGRVGNYELLEALQEKYGYSLYEIPVRLLDNISISSTRIRQALLSGDVSGAFPLLGYRYFLSGKVIQGDHRGRSIGFPTANLAVNDAQKLLPLDGVYAVRASIYLQEADLRKGFPEKSAVGGMMNLGLRPTVDGKSRTLEVNLFKFDALIYEKWVRVEFFQRLRGEQKFGSLDALKQQLQQDRYQAVQILAKG